MVVWKSAWVGENKTCWIW